VKKEMMDYGSPMTEIMFNYFRDNGYEDPQTELEFLSAVLSGTAIKYLNAPEYFHLDKLKKKIVHLYHHPPKNHL